MGVRMMAAAAAVGLLLAGCGSSVDEQLAERVAEKYFEDLQGLSEAEARSECLAWSDPAMVEQLMGAWVSGFVDAGDSQEQAEKTAAELYDATVAFCALRGW